MNVLCFQETGSVSLCLDELFPLRPVVKQMFGFTYVYLHERLLLALRDSVKRANCNGVWLYTEAQHLETLRREFPLLPWRNFWRSGRNGWVILASKLDDFEEYAIKACELIMRGDRRIGRVTRSARNSAERRRLR